MPWRYANVFLTWNFVLLFILLFTMFYLFLFVCFVWQYVKKYLFFYVLEVWPLCTFSCYILNLVSQKINIYGSNILAINYIYNFYLDFSFVGNQYFSSVISVKIKMHNYLRQVFWNKSIPYWSLFSLTA